VVLESLVARVAWGNRVAQAAPAALDQQDVREAELAQSRRRVRVVATAGRTASEIGVFPAERRPATRLAVGDLEVVQRGQQAVAEGTVRAAVDTAAAAEVMVEAAAVVITVAVVVVAVAVAVVVAAAAAGGEDNEDTNNDLNCEHHE
jgi:hypothetical protein